MSPLHTRRRLRSIAAGAAVLAMTVLAQPAMADPPQGVTLPFPGIETFRPVSPTIACGTTPTPDAMLPLRKAGFTTVISLRADGESGYDRDQVEKAALDAGLRFVAIPFTREHPDPAAVRRFLEVIAAPDTGAAFLSCHSGQRAAVMWTITRIVRDGWSRELALAEGRTLGLNHPDWLRFIDQYLESSRPR